MSKKLAHRYQKYFNGLFLVTITCLAGLILSGCSYSLDTARQVINSSGSIPKSSLQGTYKIDITGKDNEKRYISVASHGKDYFGELFLCDTKEKTTLFMQGHLLFNPIEDGWYAVSLNYITHDPSVEQPHFLVKIGKDIETALIIHALPEETLLFLASRHRIKLEKRGYSDEFSVVGQVTAESLLGYLKDILHHAEPEQMQQIQKSKGIPTAVINSGFNKFGDPLLINNESDLEKLGSSPVFVSYLKSVDQREIPWGAFLLSRLYLHGWGVENDYELAKEYANRSIHLGLEYGKVTLGDLMLSGYGEPRGTEITLKMFHEAAESGHPAAAAFLGDVYERGDGVKKNQAEAVKWYLLAAKKGDASAQFNLGFRYAKGEGVIQNDREAAKWYRKAADQGHAWAQVNLGVMYQNGTGVSKDDREAVKWYRKAADQGDATAQNNLGAMYQNGTGVPKDDRKAAKWYRKAADQGHAWAQVNLGAMYQNGTGVSKDDREALKWYRLAADQGDATAQYHLGFMYENGYGVRSNPLEASMWYKAAAEQGQKDAKKKLKTFNPFASSKPEPKEQELSTGAKIAIGVGIIAGAAILLDALNPSNTGDAAVGSRSQGSNGQVKVSPCRQEINIFPARMPCGGYLSVSGQWKAKYWCYTNMDMVDSSGKAGVTYCTDGSGVWQRNRLTDPCKDKEGWCKGGWLD